MVRGALPATFIWKGLGGATSRNRNTGRLRSRSREITSVFEVNWEALTLRILPLRPRGELR